MAARALQRSHWPDILRADSTHNHGVRKDILILAKLSTLMGLLIAIAGVVTPLGLYQALVPADNVQTPFQYLKGMYFLEELFLYSERLWSCSRLL